MNGPDELRIAHRAAIEAGSIAGDEDGSDLREASETESKEGANDLVTAIDRACQDRIVEIISNAFPEDTIVGEENDEEVTGEGREWIVDPIDGTANFSTGFPYYCISIALRVDGVGRVGIVHSPDVALGRTYYAVAGEGAYRSDDHTLDGKRLSVSDHDTLEKSIVFIRLSDRSRAWRATDMAIATALVERGSMVRRPGSAALNYCHIAEGRGDGYIILSISDWDVAAGELIVKEAGGAVYDRPIEGGKRKVIASNGQIQDQLRDIVTTSTGF